MIQEFLAKLHATSTSDMIWVGIGLLGQLTFAARFIVQWIASERAGRSVIPVAFWFLSLVGGVMLLVYALYRKDPVFIAGQSFGVFVYMRNLTFVIREQKAEVAPAQARAAS